MNELVYKCDVVYHLAAAVGVRLIVERPVHTMVTNVQGTETVLELLQPLRQARARRLELRGLRRPRTSEPLVEDDRRVYGPTTEKRWLYADSKAMDEFLALAYHQERGPRLRHRPALQHRRAAPVGAVRHGDPALRRPGPRRRGARGPRRRHADALLLPRAGHDPRAQGADGARPRSRARSSTSAGPSGSRSSSSPTRARASTGSTSSSSSSRTPRSTAWASRTRSTASRRSRRSATPSAGSPHARSSRSWAT